MNSLLAFLGSVGPPEMIIIFLVILLLFGAKKLPEFARGLGKSMGEFRKAREEFEDEIHRSSHVTDEKDDKKDEQDDKKES